MLKTERLLNSLIEASNMGICIVDQRNKIIDVNEIFCKIYETNQEDLLYKSYTSLQPEHYRDRAQLMYQNFVEGKQSSLPGQIITRNGNRKSVYASVANAEDDEGNSLKVYSLIELAAEKSDSHNLRQQPLGTQVNTGLLRIKRDGEVLYANAFARKLLYLPAGGKQLNNEVTIITDESSRKLALIDLLNEVRYLDHKEMLIDRLEHAPLWVLVSAATVISEQAEVYFDLTVVNLEDQKLNERKLIKKIDELKATNKSLDHFVYGATHDLKAPLASLSGLLHILRRESDPDQKEIFMQMMEKSINRLNEFISEIVDYSRNANQEVRREVVDFKSLIEEVFESMEHMENAHKIRPIIIVDQHTTFYSDVHRLKVVLNNLISNAYKYSSPHRRDGFIEVSAKVEYDKATLRIRDNGQGIGKDHIDKIFEMFFRASEGQGGTGLGLYLVKETLDKMEGTIHVVSELGEGTCFVVTLPRNTSQGQKKQLDLGI